MPVSCVVYVNPRLFLKGVTVQHSGTYTAAKEMYILFLRQMLSLTTLLSLV